LEQDKPYPLKNLTLSTILQLAQITTSNLYDDEVTVKVTHLLIKRDKFEFNLNLKHKKNPCIMISYLHNSDICIKNMLTSL
jgi:hypothetical protein